MTGDTKGARIGLTSHAGRPDASQLSVNGVHVTSRRHCAIVSPFWRRPKVASVRQGTSGCFALCFRQALCPASVSEMYFQLIDCRIASGTAIRRESYAVLALLLERPVGLEDAEDLSCKSWQKYFRFQ